MTISTLRKAAAIFMLAGVLGFSSAAGAATCTATNPETDPDATLTNATSCGLGTLNATDTAAEVNIAEPGSDVWVFIDKDEAAGSGATGGLLSTGVGGATSGDWGINTAGLVPNKFLIVIKDGKAGDGSTWTWFIIDTSIACSSIAFPTAVYCGSWSMYGTGRGPKAISHMSLYGTTVSSTGTPSGSTGTVPEPGSSSLALLGLGLLGAGFALRRRNGGR